MRSTSFRTLLVIGFAVFAFLAGGLIERYRARRDLAECEARNKLLWEDLTRAVSRGVLAEANLNLCKEKSK